MYVRSLLDLFIKMDHLSEESSYFPCNILGTIDVAFRKLLRELLETVLKLVSFFLLHVHAVPFLPNREHIHVTSQL